MRKLILALALALSLSTTSLAQTPTTAARRNEPNTFISSNTFRLGDTEYFRITKDDGTVLFLVTVAGVEGAGGTTFETTAAHDLSLTTALASYLTSATAASIYVTQVAHAADISTINTALAGKSNVGHTHVEGDVTGLTTDLAGKASVSHTHGESDIIGLTTDLTNRETTTAHATDISTINTALAGKASTSHAATHITGGSDVIASAVAGGNAGLMTGADKSKLDGIAAGATVGADWNVNVTNKPTLGTAAAKDIPATGNASTGQVVYGTDTRLSDARTPTAHTHPESDVVSLTTDLAAKESTTAHASDISTVNTALAAKAPLASPALTGTPTAPTPVTSDNSTTVATTAYVKGQGYVTSTTAPVTSVATKTGAVSLVVGDVSGAAPLASPTLTGTPAAPTAVDGTNTTQIATTAHVRTALTNALASYLTSATAASMYAPLSGATFSGPVGINAKLSQAFGGGNVYEAYYNAGNPRLVIGIQGSSAWPWLGHNAAQNAGTDATTYIDSRAAQRVLFNASGINLQTAVTGTAGNAITWNAGLTVDNSGNVGIGTTAPYVGFHSAKRYAFFSTADFVATSAGSGVFIGQGAASGDTFSFIQAVKTGNTAVAPLVLGGDGTTWGNVGIGGVPTSYPLEVFQASSDRLLNIHGSGSGANALLRYSDGVTSKFSTGFNNGQYIIYDDAANKYRMQIDSSGNVGIGGTPSDKLSIFNGNLHYSVADGSTFDIKPISQYGFGIRLKPNSAAGGAANRSFQIGSWDNASTYTPLVTVDESGNVGIGTTLTTPAKLSVRGTSPAIIHVGPLTTNAGDAVLAFGHGGAADYFAPTAIVARATGAWGQSNLHFVLRNAADTNVYDMATDVRMTILNSGNVGIGTTGPAVKLEVNSGADHIVGRFKGDTYGLLSVSRGTQTGASAGINFETAAVQKWFAGIYENTDDFGFYSVAYAGFPMVIKTSGNVGIGTTSPATRFANRSSATTWTTAPDGISWLSASASGGYAASIVSSTSGGAAAAYGLRVHTEQATSNDYPLNVSAGANIAFSVRGDGNIGVGTVSPAGKLHVSGVGGTANLFAQFANTDWNGTTVGSGINLRPGATSGDTYSQIQAFKAGNTPADIALNSSGGNVGIGTAAPSATLDVNGRIRSNGYLQLDADNNANSMGMYWNAHADGTGTYNYIGVGAWGGTAARLVGEGSGLRYDQASGGTNPITWVNRLSIDSAGDLGVGGTSGSYRLFTSTTAQRALGINRTETTGLRAFLDIVQNGTAMFGIGLDNASHLTIRDGSYTTEALNIDASGNVTVGGSMSTHNRSVGDGEWTTPAFSAGNFTASAGGSNSWTVTSGEVITLAYTIIGKTMIIQFNFNGTTVAGSPSSLLMMIPGGYVANSSTASICFVNNSSSGITPGMAVTSAGSNYLAFQRVGANWTAAASSTSMFGQATFDIQ